MRDYFALPHEDMGKEPSDRALRAFAACSNLLNGMYRLGEYRRVLDELNYVTDDFVREIVDDVADPPTVRRVEGIEEHTAQQEREVETLPTDHRYWRLHALTNFQWKMLSDTEVECLHWMVYFDNRVQVASDSPDELQSVEALPIVDCLQRFRFEEDRWKLSYRYYRWVHGPRILRADSFTPWR
ncbi:MAG: hypothetical protein RIE08_16085 [Acidimicrobiales bacterium]